LENKKKVLEFDLEGVRLAIQKEGQTRFKAKIVLDNLKEFSRRLTEVLSTERPHLFQYLIKQIIYGRDEIQVDLFYLPPNKMEGERDLSESAEHLRPHCGRGRRGDERILPAGSKNRSEWLPG